MSQPMKPRRCPVCREVEEAAKPRLSCRSCGFEWSSREAWADSGSEIRSSYRAARRRLRQAEIGVTVLFVVAWGVVLGILL